MIARAASLLSLTVGCGLFTASAPSLSAQPAAPAASTASSPLQAVIDAARADAAGRSGQPLGHVHVRRAESVTWPDGSLGCPQPDEMYTQALVPGFRVELRVGRQAYDYRADTHGTLRLCPATRPHPPRRSTP